MPASDIEVRRSLDQQERFLVSFATSGSVGEACLDTGISVNTANGWVHTDLHGFKSRKAEAGQIALGHYEKEIRRRAIEGVDHPVIHQGVITDTYKTYSDNLLMFRAKRLDPEYRDNYSAPSRQDIPAITQIIIHLPPGASSSEPTLVVDGKARLVPDEEDAGSSSPELGSD